MLKKFLAVVVGSFICLCTPALATPVWYSNGVKLGATHIPVLAWGTVSYTSSGENTITCKDLAEFEAWNGVALEVGSLSFQGFSSFDCVGTGSFGPSTCPGESGKTGIDITAEKVPVEVESAFAEWSDVFTLPWEATLGEEEGAKGFDLSSGGGGFELSFGCKGFPFAGRQGYLNLGSGVIGIRVENGKKNGLNPSSIQTSPTVQHGFSLNDTIDGWQVQLITVT